MNTTKKLVLAAAVFPLMFATASAYAFGGKSHNQGGEGKCSGGFDRGIMRQLDLTEEQKSQMQALRETTKGDKKAQRQAGSEEKRALMQAHQKQVQALVLADTFDEDAANALASEMVEKQTERRVNKLKDQHKMLSLLTDEQKSQFVELQQERMQKCSDKMQKKMKNS
ncbi:CpxP family protein [Vibrio genomosp. F10]|uniref:Stress adaptor protein CpxP n=2 Tax=Vibrio genomosp. F10 TaxID=723171 RepID=A0A1B9QX50_9VIBR|nr:CpxP family protein [Vibrio genomosp. F10]OCH74259.1 stress adaptor protein CpxP [Vibrio genomosp. F10]OEE31068.1 stress adaptor protein CpxP [Vibrio genomosp. F10 str. ZF-129]OEE98501.1 stress adaptor protein CpxP [Vibrio genomosp. F10 str. 9ZC157]OEF19860.1 stress adaptor protein CpxP [Vibrio genomosp. F10 str. 9ZD137]